MTSPEPTIGYVGVGSMGGALVQALLRAGTTPLVFDLDARHLQAAVDAGATAARTLEDLAAACDIVGIVVATDEQVRAVLEGGLLDHLRPGSVVALHSTVLPDTVRWAAEATAAHGCGFVEAPVTGGAVAAAEGRLTFLLAGSEADRAAIEPILAAAAARRIDAGGFGDANLLKLCINLQTYVTHRAAHEAASLATALGLQLDSLKSAMEGNGQLGELTRNYLLLHELPRELVENPAGLERRELDMAVIGKDLRHLAEIAAGAGVDIPGAAVAAETMRDTYFMPPEIYRRPADVDRNEGDA